MNLVERRLRGAAADERGFGVIEMLVAMTMLSVAIGALVSVFAASAVSLHRSSDRGTAVSLAESQMEVYRTLPYTGIRIDGSQIPTSTSDPYVTAHAGNADIPPSTGQALGGQNGDDACPSTDLPAACEPVQNPAGPDGAHRFDVDTYVDYVNDDGTLSIRTPAAGLTLKLVTVVVRNAGTNEILAEDSSAFQGP